MKDYNGIIITGPTACGKSSFAIEVARAINGTIINADSQQIYYGTEIVSASPYSEFKADENRSIRARKPERPYSDLIARLKLNPTSGIVVDGIPHKLFSIRDGEQPLSASEYSTLAKRAYDETLSEWRIPIFVGGTGFYLNSLTNGLSEIPEIDDSTRTHAREMTKSNIASAYTFLLEKDPEWASKIASTDSQRISRGIEVFLQTNKPLSVWQKQPKNPAITDSILKILIMPDRDILRERIRARIDTMLCEGMKHEIRVLMRRNLNPELPIMKADGISEFSSYLRGEILYEDALSKMIGKSTHYMKRQITFFTHNFTPDVTIDHVPTKSDVKKLPL